MVAMLDEVMQLAKALCVTCEAMGGWNSPETRMALLGLATRQQDDLEAALRPIIADAQRYRSLQGKTDEQA